tara:strand:+ start:5968 stop:6804 length:837 start_codon:yes stop_codon:yes gene_type:complete
MEKNIKLAQWEPQKAGEYHKETKLDVVYGPINSRRLGLSLGINPIQGGFACNWSCVYCQYGAESLDESIEQGRIRMSTPGEIRKGLEMRLSSNEHYNSITLCGPTEPTLSPYFNEIADLTAEMRDTYRPEIPTSLFTNASKLRDKNLNPFDYVFMKLDAGNEETFRKFNRPKGVKFDELIRELREAPVKNRIIQTAVVDGKDGNLTEDNLREYEERIREINPDEIHLYPLLYKPFPEFDLKSISGEELEKLAKRINSSTNVKVFTFIDPTNVGSEFRF